jgi:L-malate glycosyltransferase
VSEGSSAVVGPDEPLRLAFLGDPNLIHMRRWIGFFEGRGHRITMLVPHGFKMDPGLPASVEVATFSAFNPRSPLAPLGFIRSCLSLRRVLGRVKPDVLNAHFLTIHGWHAWMSGFHPYAVTLWGSDIYIAPMKWRTVRIMARVTLRAADLVMADSADLKLGAEELRARPDHTELIGWGVDLARFSGGSAPAELRTRLGLDGKRVVFAPRVVTPLYRNKVIVEAMAQVPADVVVLMSLLNAESAEVEEINQLAVSLGISDRIVYVPNIPHAEMPDFIRLADVVASVPMSDSTSVSILEALACERQIVAADLPSVREWLAELDPESLVPVDDVAATAVALNRALSRTAAQRAEIGRRGRAIVAERADQARALGAVEQLYRRLCRPNTRLPA